MSQIDSKIKDDFQVVLLCYCHFSWDTLYMIISIIDWIYRVSHETWQLVNSLKCLLPWLIKLFDAKENNKKYYIIVKNEFKLKYIWVKDFFKQNNLQKVLINQYSIWQKTFKTIYQLSCFVGRGEEGQPHQSVVPATFSSFSSPSHLEILVLSILFFKSVSSSQIKLFLKNRATLGHKRNIEFLYIEKKSFNWMKVLKFNVFKNFNNFYAHF